MGKSWLSKISSFLKYALLIGAILYIALYLVVVYFRIQYPFELMWQEGASVDHMKRIVDGYGYYVHPSLEFVPSIYTPLYFYVSALLAKFIGIGFLPIRLVSFMASIGCFFLIYFFVKKETKSSYYALIAVGFFSATYDISGAWFDIGRADSLFLFLCLTSIYLIKFGRQSKYFFLAGILISLSFLTKQTALVITLPIILYCFLSDKRTAVYFIIPIILMVGLGSFLLNYIHDGWFNFYVFELPRTTPVRTEYILNFWLYDILKSLPVAFLFSVFFLVHLLIMKSGSNKKDFLFYIFFAIGMFVASWYSRFRGGGLDNVLIPSHAILAILFAIGFYTFLEFNNSLPEPRRSILKIFIYMLCITQFVVGDIIYNPMKQIPTKNDLYAGFELTKKLAQIEGEVFSPFHGYLPALAGKKSYANMMGLRDVITTSSREHQKVKDKIIDEIKQAMREKKFGAIIIDSFEPWYPPDMEKYYVKKERIFEDESVFFPVTSMRTRPEFIYVPKRGNAFK
jgi:4-amino-4-deoxy-L-arabinose transferase-like glycosyltransferase